MNTIQNTQIERVVSIVEKYYIIGKVLRVTDSRGSKAVSMLVTHAANLPLHGYSDAPLDVTYLDPCQMIVAFASKGDIPADAKGQKIMATMAKGSDGKRWLRKGSVTVEPFKEPKPEQLPLPM